MATRIGNNEIVECIFAAGGDYWVYETDNFLEAVFCHGQFYTMEATLDYIRSFNTGDSIITIVID